MPFISSSSEKNVEVKFSVPTLLTYKRNTKSVTFRACSDFDVVLKLFSCLSAQTLVFSRRLPWRLVEKLNQGVDLDVSNIPPNWLLPCNFHSWKTCMVLSQEAWLKIKQNVRKIIFRLAWKSEDRLSQSKWHGHSLEMCNFVAGESRPNLRCTTTAFKLSWVGLTSLMQQNPVKHQAASKKLPAMFNFQMFSWASLFANFPFQI